MFGSRPFHHCAIGRIWTGVRAAKACPHCMAKKKKKKKFYAASRGQTKVWGKNNCPILFLNPLRWHQDAERCSELIYIGLAVMISSFLHVKNDTTAHVVVGQTSILGYTERCEGCLLLKLLSIDVVNSLFFTRTFYFKFWLCSHENLNVILITKWLLFAREKMKFLKRCNFILVKPPPPKKN